MYLTKCDFCKKVIKNESIRVGFGFANGLDLCEKCGKPVVDFLKENGVLDEENKRVIKDKKRKTA
ncbi:MAG: hypothetical protein A2365_01305 [Candidatus Nealsonbacteria bacterium RIFOXYB1_FULL_40_15]|uniref:Uncharacterized protein n=2 Tax=Candidatus Nealsoniibacteriota TaxID=1817911 RepID=A0A1G2EQ39_9BACT|nr:MAG: hypothetical protein A2365_01305 [Candidatus Nealsonbacteria bacterium RIFOXYB1_FULL_40_15]OGZ27857.1 MAG: hypothetical protein A2427_04040 [Candidatus Nealsonbacteria bacterium RIFOXYC1_FULL_40_7]OGZ28017.1 MAG: hypothetical protein A2562_01385 [Candidatus Nealsonbacteria bacterium RIFOXYD1_FULL_39_11]